MKHNLKTRPQTEDYDDCYKYADALKKWFSACEKELQQLRKDVVFTGKTPTQLIDEILGENQP